ncbi:MAG TPA: DUF1345 domain-containing protein [Pseudolabrys sp.]|jgi:uncharacterized membrane protein|nr:DUF1345 domain-containing protein [Pseudolabrys sp.]
MARRSASSKRRPLPIRIALLHAKLFGAVILGIIVVLVMPHEWHLTTRLLIGWDVGLVTHLGTIAATMRRADIDRIRRRAAEEDEGAIAILVLSIGATIASVVSVVAELGGSKQATGISAAAQILLAVVTILLSWSFMHTIFSLHYAREYYGRGRDKKIGGLNFPGDNAPDYWDFLYFSLVIGMTSQVSDVGITSKSIRRVAALHGALSFFFNVTVLALTVNILSNLL